VVSEVGRGMGVLGLGVNLGRPIVTNGDFVALLWDESDALFPNYFGEDLFTWMCETIKRVEILTT